MAVVVVVVAVEIIGLVVVVAAAIVGLVVAAVVVTAAVRSHIYRRLLTSHRPMLLTVLVNLLLLPCVSRHAALPVTLAPKIWLLC